MGLDAEKGASGTNVCCAVAQYLIPPTLSQVKTVPLTPFSPHIYDHIHDQIPKISPLILIIFFFPYGGVIVSIKATSTPKLNPTPKFRKDL